jgi:hypothetical protein
MVKTNALRFSPIHLLLLLFVGLSGCGTTSDLALVRSRDSGGKHSERLPFRSLPVQPDLLDQAAIFSALVYADVPLTTKLENAPPGLETPEQLDHVARMAAMGWSEVTDIPRPQVSGRRQTPDLTYRVWVHPAASPTVAILAFRGTHIRPDWYSNLRWIDSWIPRVEDHYEQTERVTPQIVASIRKTYPGITIVATGHSLGGGLAQTAAYTACGAIPTVIAFDSSPVTKHRAANACSSGASPSAFYRVFEQSEILSYARFLVRQIVDLKVSDPKIVEIKVHLFHGVGVRAHSMQELAAHLNQELQPAQVKGTSP